MPFLLVVDDEPGITEAYALLFGLEGFEVATAQDGQAALAQAACRRPDLVITDYAMPGIDGLHLCTRFRQDPALRSVPLILSSAQTLSPPGPRPPWDLFLPKPVDFNALLVAVRGLLPATAPAACACLDRS